jgi:putative Mg2+ transporter-C (MgtC) family protein
MNAASLAAYWTGPALAANALVAINLLGGLLLGMLVGYERSYQGRAAGMRTYGLVSMASTALTVFAGYAPSWYGGIAPHVATDPTRVVQGIVTGIGFLGAGVIMKDGPNISGLTTAASIWTASAMGVLVGVGFYGAAIALALLCMASLSLMHRLESRLPGRSTLELSLCFHSGEVPDFDELVETALARGYEVLRESLVILVEDGRLHWRFSAVTAERSRAVNSVRLAHEIASSANVARFSIAPVRH